MRRKLAISFLIVLLCAVAVLANTQGPNNCGAGANVTTTGNPWSNPGNACTSGQFSQAGSIPASSQSDELNLTSFGFSIPAGSTINGVQASFTRSGTGSKIKDWAIQLIKGGVVSGTDHSNAAIWPGSATAQNYGSTSDLWGLTLTPTDVNASNFGLDIQANNTDTVNPQSANVNAFVTITVTFTPPAGRTQGIIIARHAARFGGDSMTVYRVN